MSRSNICHAALSLPVALLLVGCVDPTAELDDLEELDEIDQIGGAQQALTDGVPTGPGGYELAFEVSTGDQREYFLYLPDGYLQNRAQPYPLVAMFHGLGGSAASFAATLDAAGLRDLANQQDKIVVFLQGTLGLTITQQGFWNLGSGGRDDVLYTQELLDHLASELDVDETRVFAGGHSLGGRFVHELGARDPSRFRAIADVSGFYGTPAGEPAAPPAGTLLPVLIVHGAVDPVVPLAGGPVFLPTEYNYTSWYANDDCTEPTNRLLSLFWDIETTVCRAGTTHPIIQRVIVSGLDHHWPRTADGFDASSEMLDFFDMQ